MIPLPREHKLTSGDRGPEKLTLFGALTIEKNLGKGRENLYFCVKENRGRRDDSGGSFEKE